MRFFRLLGCNNNHRMHSPSVYAKRKSQPQEETWKSFVTHSSFPFIFMLDHDLECHTLDTRATKKCSIIPIPLPLSRKSFFLFISIFLLFFIMSSWRCSPLRPALGLALNDLNICLDECISQPSSLSKQLRKMGKRDLKHC